MLTVKNLVKTYHTKGGVVTKALDNVSVDFPETGMVFLLGKSGSGKSTLLNMIGGLDRPDSGEVIVKGKSSKNFSTRDFDSYRNTFIGFIFQEYNILNEFNVEQNIALALQLQGKKANKEAIAKLLKEVDLVGLEKRKPNTLSGGQKQRIAIARALIKEPQIIMADEPTGALDSNTGKQVFDTLKKLSKQKLVIVVSHDREFAQHYGDRIIELKDGKIISDDSKVYQQAKKVSENVSLISGNIIQIKNASKLSAKDDKAIIEALKKQKGEVIISGGNNNLPNIKKALKINESGASESFDKTTKVNIKQYDGNQTKFIKSKMPFWRAFKIGASGLKTKPFRLVMTILLSTVSFAMFGVVSTLMLYNANYSIREAMNNVDYITETIVKKYYYTPQEIRMNYKTGDVSVTEREKNTTNTRFGEQELKDLNKANPGFEFAGSFNFATSNNNSVSFKIEKANVTGSNKDYFPYDSFSGFSDCGEEYLNKYFSIAKTSRGTDCGRYPIADNEIAISNYIADDLLYSEFATTDMKDYEDLLDKPIKITNNFGKSFVSEELKISGVYQIGSAPSEYDSLKNEKQPSESNTKRQELIEKYKNFINGGFFRTAFVNDKFYENHKALVEEDSVGYLPNVSTKYLQTSSSYISKEQEVYEYGQSLTGFDLVKDMAGIKFYQVNSEEAVDVKNITLDKLDIIIPKNEYEYATNTSIGKYGSVREAYMNFSYESGYINYLSEEEKEEREDINANYFPHFQEVTINNESKDIEFFVAYNKIKDFLDRCYKRCAERYFLSNDGYNYFYCEVAYDSYGKYNQIKSDPSWDDIKEIYEKISTSEKISEGNWIDLSNFTKKYTNDVLPYRNMVYYHIGDELRNKGGWQFYNYLSDTNYNELLSNLYGEPQVEDITKFKEFTAPFYKKIYGKEINFDNVDSFYPTFEPCYDYNAYYFYKDINGSGEMNVKYYYVFGSNTYGNPIVSRDFILDHISDDSYVWMSSYVTSYEAPSDAKYNNLMVPTDYSDNQIAVMMQKHDTFCYEMSNPTYSQISIMIDLINQFKRIFLYVGIGTGALAALLLANFISASISNKKKDIGILRAVGAKSGDVFKVFWSESGIIAFICFVLATVSAAITSTALNNTIAGTLITIKVLNFGITNILIILGAAIIISLLATLFPVLRAAKKPPVEAIRSL